jgi:hypothetical protein
VKDNYAKIMGGATDVEEMEKNEGIDVVVDLLAEATECA